MAREAGRSSATAAEMRSRAACGSTPSVMPKRSRRKRWNTAYGGAPNPPHTACSTRVSGSFSWISRPISSDSRVLPTPGGPVSAMNASSLRCCTASSAPIKRSHNSLRPTKRGVIG